MIVIKDRRAAQSDVIDSKARQEVSEIDAKAEESDFNRREIILKSLSFIFIVALWFIFFAGICVGYHWLHDLISPEEDRLLDPARFQMIQSMLFSGVISVAFAGATRRLVSNK
jgi:hypothetical protein